MGHHGTGYRSLMYAAAWPVGALSCPDLASNTGLLRPHVVFSDQILRARQGRRHPIKLRKSLNVEPGRTRTGQAKTRAQGRTPHGGERGLGDGRETWRWLVSST
ncbi:hypothetical protein E4U54_002271 [Claviceps lovelessii]|nr:hypothetical protein E4U54_002271 [Claviceps lovelessii]